MRLERLPQRSKARKVSGDNSSQRGEPRSLAREGLARDDYQRSVIERLAQRSEPRQVIPRD